MFQNFRNSIMIETELPDEITELAKKYCRLCCKDPEFILLGETCDSRKKKEFEKKNSILERKNVIAYVKCKCCNKISKISYYYQSTYNSYIIDDIEVFKFKGGIEKIQKEMTVTKPLIEINCIDNDKLSNVYITDLKNIGTREVFRYSYLIVYI